jgi:hypothetical protein
MDRGARGKTVNSNVVPKSGVTAGSLLRAF